MPERRTGRPRDPKAHAAILNATRDLLVTRGYERLSIEGIATAAGVSRQTVYRRWPSKAAVVSDALLSDYSPFDQLPVEDSGDLRRDLGDWVQMLLRLVADPQVAALARALAAAASDSDSDNKLLFENLNNPIRDTLMKRLSRARGAGIIRFDADLDAVVDALFGLVLIRAMTVERVTSSLNADGIMDFLFRGIQPESS